MKKEAFSLIEILVVIIVFTTAIIGMLITINNTVNSFTLATNRFVASNLTIEGVENIRNKRDNNLIERRAWNDDLHLGEVDRDSFLLNGIIFTRIVTIHDISGVNAIEIVSKITWLDREGKTEEEKLVMRLFEY